MGSPVKIQLKAITTSLHEFISCEQFIREGQGRMKHSSICVWLLLMGLVSCSPSANICRYHESMVVIVMSYPCDSILQPLSRSSDPDTLSRPSFIIFSESYEYGINVLFRTEHSFIHHLFPALCGQWASSLTLIHWEKKLLWLRIRATFVYGFVINIYKTVCCYENLAKPK